MLCYQKDYPRPQFVRDDWASLNGIWNFSFDDSNKGEAEGWYKGFHRKKRSMSPSPMKRRKVIFTTKKCIIMCGIPVHFRLTKRK